MANLIYALNPFTIPNTVIDPDNFPNTGITYFWTQTAGPATATFDNIYAQTPTITCPIAGNYTFQMTASDSITPTSASVTVQVLPYYISTKTYTATCPVGTSGSNVTKTGIYTSVVSQTDADNKALNAATTAASAAITCSAFPAQWTLIAASGLVAAETLVYKLYVLTAGNSNYPISVTLLATYTTGANIAQGQTIDYTSIVTSYTNEQVFIWTYTYTNTTTGITYTLPIEPTVTVRDPVLVTVGSLHTYKGILLSNAMFIDAPNVQQAQVAITHKYSTPASSRLYIYNWDGRNGTTTNTYDYLKISWLSGGTPSVPTQETVLDQLFYSNISYGSNVLDIDDNFLPLDKYLPSLPSLNGVLIVRRGVFISGSNIISYSNNSATLYVNAQKSGTTSVVSISANAPIPSNANGALQLSTNTNTLEASIIVESFNIDAHGWRSGAASYDHVVIVFLIGSPGSFTGYSGFQAIAMPDPSVPQDTTIFEINPPVASGSSFVIYAANAASGSNLGAWTLAANSFPVSTSYTDVLGNLSSSPYSVSSLGSGVITGLPAATNGVVTINNANAQVILRHT